MKIIRCVSCWREFEEPIGYLGHECEPIDRTLVFDPERVEAIVVDETFEQIVETEFEDDGIAVDLDELRELGRNVGEAILLTVAAVGLVGLLAYDRIVELGKRVLR